MNWLPPQASSIASHVDALSFALIALSTVVIVGVFTAMIFFSIKYRHGSKANRQEREEGKYTLEISWTLIPLLAFLALFLWSIDLYARLRTPPPDAETIYVVAKQWMWMVKHGGGQQEINTLHVPLGRPVRLLMTSEDVIHSFYVPAFRVKQDVLPGRYTELWFTATETGSFHLFCAEFCGTEHSRMRGRVEVLPAAEYATWLAAHPSAGLAEQGAALFRRFGCSGCHMTRNGLGPNLVGLYGSPVPLSDGTVVMADERYIYDSIMLPNTQIAAGYPAIMPSFQGQISEDEVLALIAYLKSMEGERQP